MSGEGEGRRRGSGPGRPDGMRGEGEERRRGSGRRRAGRSRGEQPNRAEGMTPLMFASHHVGNEAIVKYLISNQADPNKADNSGITPLHIAARQGCYEIAEYLLSKGANVDPLCQDGQSPLLCAALQGNERIVTLLLKHNADYNRMSKKMITPLLASLHCSSLSCLEILIEAGADVNFRSPSGPVILMEAVDDGFTEIVKFLLEAGADPNIADEDGRIPIMCAGAHGKRELVEILFPWTKPIPSMPEWSVDGIIRGMRYLRFEAQGAVLEEHIADAKSSGKEAFAKGEYFAAVYFYGRALDRDPLDATLLANISLCWLRVRDGKQALSFAQKCRMMCPRWSKAWYREGAALRFLKHYRGAVDAFKQALKLDPASNEIKNALGEATDAMRNTTRS
ncbi:ankyrin-1 isoform X1 [Sorghum bicolor]|uniref:ankyrin-1 isoform X1 n=1 Tax=Sorghum bicolor TaxID=4558 RepID=UPI000B426491|nr:ankyrin-1 isoform X1 [Sorghum bicolor]|eukprot:XP_021301267.1 ankyrin-1 isoform X1 [Sorghum bicolor]